MLKASEPMSMSQNNNPKSNKYNQSKVPNVNVKNLHKHDTDHNPPHKDNNPPEDIDDILPFAGTDDDIDIPKQQHMLASSSDDDDESSESDAEDGTGITIDGTISNKLILKSKNNNFNFYQNNNNMLFFADNDVCFSAWMLDCSCFMPDSEDLSLGLECMFPCMNCNGELSGQFLTCVPRCGCKTTACCVGCTIDPGTVCECCEDTAGASGEVIVLTKSICA